jgi:hypothetical protein
VAAGESETIRSGRSSIQTGPFAACIVMGKLASDGAGVAVAVSVIVLPVAVGHGVAPTHAAGSNQRATTTESRARGTQQSQGLLPPDRNARSLRRSPRGSAHDTTFPRPEAPWGEPGAFERGTVSLHPGGRSPDSRITARPSLPRTVVPVASLGVAPRSQWRDRAGLAPASLLSRPADTARGAAPPGAVLTDTIMLAAGWRGNPELRARSAGPGSGRRQPSRCAPCCSERPPRPRGPRYGPLPVADMHRANGGAGMAPQGRSEIATDGASRSRPDVQAVRINPPQSAPGRRRPSCPLPGEASRR